MQICCVRASGVHRPQSSSCGCGMHFAVSLASRLTFLLHSHTCALSSCTVFPHFLVGMLGSSVIGYMACVGPHPSYDIIPLPVSAAHIFNFFTALHRLASQVLCFCITFSSVDCDRYKNNAKKMQKQMLNFKTDNSASSYFKQFRPRPTVTVFWKRNQSASNHINENKMQL